MNGKELIYDRKLEGEIRATLPTSKSMAARALVIGALAGVRPAAISSLPVCTDTTELSAAVNALLDAIPSPASRLNEPESPMVCLNLDLGLGGTSLRFFTAVAASMPRAEFELECAAPLKKRPLAPLCEALKTAGADIEYLKVPGYPPLFIKGTHIRGGERGISASISSQFVSAMIMCAPYWSDGLSLSLTGDQPVSIPYIDMTIKMMRRAGAAVTADEGHRHISVEKGGYDAAAIPSLSPEADWSAASYFYELALALPHRPIRISSLTPPSESLQGDSACADIFKRVGIETEFMPDGSALLRCDYERLREAMEASRKNPVEFDMSDTPDLVPALAVGLCLAGIRYHIIGIGHLRHKESDRIAAIQNELEKIGYGAESTENTLSWNGRRTPVAESETIDTYHDHRIAMAFAVAAAKLPYLSIHDPKVVEKSFPDYFLVLKEAGFRQMDFGGSGN